MKAHRIQFYESQGPVIQRAAAFMDSIGPGRIISVHEDYDLGCLCAIYIWYWE